MTQNRGPLRDLWTQVKKNRFKLNESSLIDLADEAREMLEQAYNCLT